MQDVIRGENALLQAGQLIRKAGYSAVFLVTGSHFNPGKLSDSLEGILVHHFIKKGPNVAEDEMLNAARAFGAARNAAILTVGGGSVMDLAKSVIYQLSTYTDNFPLLIAVPTTAGSGSEATHFAVIYRQNRKESLVHQAMLPGIVILDPLLTESLAPYQAAVSGMDAFAQAVESYWSSNATAVSREYSTRAILLWKEYFLPAVIGGNRLAREKMLESAFASGQAINITRTTGPHALSYFLTARYQVPHGQAVAVFLPVFFLYNDVPTALFLLLEVPGAQDAKNYVQQQMKKAGLATTLAELGIDKTEAIDGILDEVNEERFANNPARFDREKLKEMILLNL